MQGNYTELVSNNKYPTVVPMLVACHAMTPEHEYGQCLPSGISTFCFPPQLILVTQAKQLKIDYKF